MMNHHWWSITRERFHSDFEFSVNDRLRCVINIRCVFTRAKLTFLSDCFFCARVFPRLLTKSDTYYSGFWGFYLNWFSSRVKTTHPFYCLKISTCLFRTDSPWERSLGPSLWKCISVKKFYTMSKQRDAWSNFVSWINKNSAVLSKECLQNM